MTRLIQGSDEMKRTPYPDADSEAHINICICCVEAYDHQRKRMNESFSPGAPSQITALRD
jgi:hypothetical protein